VEDIHRRLLIVAFGAKRTGQDRGRRWPVGNDPQRS